MKIEASTPAHYIQQMPEDRREAMQKLRQTIQKNIPKGFEETIIYDSIGYVVPKATYPDGYHCDTSLPLPFLNIASQKNFIALYHMGIYMDKELLDWFVKEYPKHSKLKLDMGKSCIRFKKFDQIPYTLIAELVKKMSMKDWIKLYESNIKKR
jgi:uncharacterized protein YdhG (YjbR/CyaY superfamily)